MSTPHVGDHVYVPWRLLYKLNPHGWITRIVPRRNWDQEREVVVRFARPLLWAKGIDPEFYLPGGDSDTLTFEECYEYKVSSELPEGTFTDYRTERRRYHDYAEGRLVNGRTETDAKDVS
jgi:hypothetical protein